MKDYMKDQALKQLKQELRQAGARTAEISELSNIAAELPRLKHYEPAQAESMSVEQRLHGLLKPLTGGLAGLALGVLLILIAQPVLPTSKLYAVQKFSDSVAVDVHPQYRATVMMKRAQQVNALVASHASSDKILATLADYTNQAKIYQDLPHANYAAFEFCKTNLQQAAANAPQPVKSAIANSLQSLETT